MSEAACDEAALSRASSNRSTKRRWSARSKPRFDRAAPGVGRVFVVDDDISVRESLELLLETDGREVLSFTCATDFIDHHRTAAPSCVVLDVDLPDINGLDLQDRLCSALSTTPI